MFDPKTALEGARRNLLMREHQLREERETLPTREPEFEEQASLLRETALIERLDARAIAELAEIDLALTKVSAGVWGLCEACGEPIERPRIEAMPEARLCLSCAEAFELRGEHLPEADEVQIRPAAAGN